MTTNWYREALVQRDQSDGGADGWRNQFGINVALIDSMRVLTASAACLSVNPFETAERHESISLAFLVLLESLTPAERAVFLLHDVFDFDYREIAEMSGISAANCRQICHRAKAYIAERHHRFDAPRDTQLRLISRFLLACQEGDVQGLKDMLAQDVMNWGDGGGKAVAARRPIMGVEAVTRFWLAIARKPPANLALSIEDVNGGPAVLLWVDNALYAVVTFDVIDGQIHAIRNVLNPDKLAYIGRQLLIPSEYRSRDPERRDARDHSRA